MCFRAVRRWRSGDRESGEKLALLAAVGGALNAIDDIARKGRLRVRGAGSLRRCALLGA